MIYAFKGLWVGEDSKFEITGVFLVDFVQNVQNMAAFEHRSVFRVLLIKSLSCANPENIKQIL